MSNMKELLEQLSEALSEQGFDPPKDPTELLALAAEQWLLETGYESYSDNIAAAAQAADLRLEIEEQLSDMLDPDISIPFSIDLDGISTDSTYSPTDRFHALVAAYPGNKTLLAILSEQDQDLIEAAGVVLPNFPPGVWESNEVQLALNSEIYSTRSTGRKTE